MSENANQGAESLDVQVSKMHRVFHGEIEELHALHKTNRLLSYAILAVVVLFSFFVGWGLYNQFNPGRLMQKLEEPDAKNQVADVLQNYKDDVQNQVYPVFIEELNKQREPFEQQTMKRISDEMPRIRSRALARLEDKVEELVNEVVQESGEKLAQGYGLSQEQIHAFTAQLKKRFIEEQGEIVLKLHKLYLNDLARIDNAVEGMVPTDNLTKEELKERLYAALFKRLNAEIAEVPHVRK